MISQDWFLIQYERQNINYIISNGPNLLTLEWRKSLCRDLMSSQDFRLWKVSLLGILDTWSIFRAKTKAILNGSNFEPSQDQMHIPTCDHGSFDDFLSYLGVRHVYTLYKILAIETHQRLFWNENLWWNENCDENCENFCENFWNWKWFSCM